MRNAFLLLALIGTLSPLKSNGLQQVMPDSSLEMPVLIEIPNTNGTTSKYGTGIYLNVSNKCFLVTAAHCIFNVASTNNSELNGTILHLSSKAGNPTAKEKLHLRVVLDELQKVGRVKRHPTRDICVIQIAESWSNQPNQLQYDSRYCIPARQDLPLNAYSQDATIQFTNVLNSSDVVILGYPIELLNNNGQTPPHIDFSEPLVRKGIVSQKNTITRKYIIDSGVYGGNSGGPVFYLDHVAIDMDIVRVMGIITEFVPYQTRVAPSIGATNQVMVNSGYGVAEPIEYALELIRQF